MKKRLVRVLCIGLAAALLATSGFAAEEVPSMQDDFYGAVNAQWLSTAEIPADKPAIGGFSDLSDGVQEALMADFGAMLRGEKEPDNEELANFIELYRLAADFEARNAAGAAPLQPYIEQVEDLTSLEDFSSQWAQWDMAGMFAPFAVVVMADMKDADTNALYIQPPSLFLLDKSYYADDATKTTLQSAYAQMSKNLLVLAGKTEEEADAIVVQALAFDESLAPHTKGAEESSDYTKLYNPTDFAAFDDQIEGFDFTASFQELLGAVPETIIVTDPDYFAALNELVNEETFSAMQSWMLVLTVNSFATVLSDDFRVEADSFNRMLSGIAESASPEKSAYTIAAGTFSEVVGIYYGKTYLGEQGKKDVADMVGALIDTYESRLAANTWLSEDTRAMAVKKLNAMTINVGYPDEARPFYSLLKTVPAAEGGTLISNLMAFNRIVKEDNYSKWNTPVDRGLWPLSADTVNAMYSPQDNSINFPAAILQAPFYSLEQSASANYGGIGAVIAHEISHAFDPNGSKFDKLGSLTDWWTAEDYAEFDELSKAMTEEFDGLEYAGGTVNGTQTLAENVADAGGISCALEAAKAKGDVDLEAFFTNWAVIWRMKASPEYEALLLTMDVHAPQKLRANIQLQNMDDFFTTFNVQEGDGMYRAPEDRVAIW